MRRVAKIKARYYSKEVLKYLFLAGAVCVAATSPYFALNFTRSLSKSKFRIPKKKTSSTFRYLKRRGLIDIKRDGHDIKIALTEKGKKRAGKYQIDDLEITKPKKWDKKWRVVIFDIPHLKRTERNAFRGKLKELSFCPIQKSIWVHAFDCKEEIKLLREFFGLDKKQVQVLLVERIEDSASLKKFFNL